MGVPFYVTLAKERATAFRREAELLAANFQSNRPQQNWDHLRAVLEPHRHNDRLGGYCSPIDVLSVLNEALGWAYDPSSKPADIRQAKSELEAASSECLGAWKIFAQMLTLAMPDASRVHWVWRATAAGTAQYNQAKSSLATQWPLTEGDDDRVTPAELEAGGGIEMEDAFALLAGVGGDEWRAMVAAHPAGRGRGIPGEL